MAYDDFAGLVADEAVELMVVANPSQLHCQDSIAAMRAGKHVIVESGELGRIVLMRFTDHGFSRRWDWQTLKQYGGGILNNKGAHTIDWALLFVDDPEPEVMAHMETPPLYAGDAESHAKLIIRPKDGPMIDIEMTHTNAYPQESCLIMATQGSLSSNRELIR